MDDDDFTIAWEILDLARILYQKRQSEGEEVGRELGECFGLLGDVSLEGGESGRWVRVFRVEKGKTLIS